MKTACLGKIWFFSYGLKCSQPIRLQYSLIINISGRSQLISQIFYVEIIIKERSHLILLLLLGCCKFCSLPKRVAGFSIFNIPGRNQSISYVFLQGNNYLWEVASETTTFDWVWQIVPFVQSDCRISFLWKESSDICVFLHGVNHQGKVTLETSSFSWVSLVVTLVQSYGRILWSWISQQSQQGLI